MQNGVHFLSAVIYYCRKALKGILENKSTLLTISLLADLQKNASYNWS